MTERNLAIRLSVLDGGKVKAELREVGDTGEKSLKRIELAGTPASRGLMAINAAANDVRESAVGMAQQLGPVGAGLTVLGPAGIAAGVAIAGLVGVFRESISAGGEAERALNRISAVLKATGNASGLTAAQLEEYAEGIERSTLATSEQILDAASVLATFRSVSGDTFERALGLAQDMAVVFGGDAATAAKQLGKALQDPEVGITALTRVGVVFNDTQKDLIKTLMNSGQTVAAQKVVLDELQNEIGGAAAGEKKGLVGATNDLSDAWDNLLKDLGRTQSVAGPVETFFKGLTNIFDYLRESAQPSVGDQIESTTKQLQAAQQAIASLKNPGAGESILANGPMIAAQERRVAELQAKLKQILADSDKETADDAAAQKVADDGKARAQAQDRLNKITEQRKAIDDALDKLVTDPAAKIAKVNQELDQTKARLSALKEKDGSNAGAVDGAIAQAEKLAKLQIAAIQKPLNEASDKLGDSTAKVIDDLQNKLKGFTDKRAAFIEGQLQRLDKKVSPSSQAETRDLAGKLYDQTDAQEKLNKLTDDAKSLTKDNQSATDAYTTAVDRLNKMMQAHLITQDVYDKALGKAKEDLLKGRTDADAGAQRAFAAYEKNANDAASQVEKAFTSAMNATDDAITKAITSAGDGLTSLRDLASTIVNDITRMFVQKTITQPLFSAAGGLFEDGGALSGIFSSVFHAGGVVGEAAQARYVSAASFADAPRYHSGGIAGLKSDEVPAILQRGETVLPKGASRASKQEFNFNVSVSGPAAGNPQLAAQSGRALAQAMRASILDTIQDQQRSGGLLYGHN